MAGGAVSNVKSSCMGGGGGYYDNIILFSNVILM